MEKTANKAAAKKQAVRFFCVTMAILLVSSIFIWGFQSGWGAVKIRHALAAKGVGQDVICAALEEIDTARADMRLEKLMENKLRSLAGDPQCRLKMLRFGLGRGYGYNEVSRVIDVLLKRVSP